MNCHVMSLKSYSDISYRVKCVAVESERVFGDVFVTQQNAYPTHYVDDVHCPPVFRRRQRNLVQQSWNGPDFMEMNRKRPSRRASETTNVPVRVPVRRSKSMADDASVLGFNRENSVARSEESVRRPRIYPVPLSNSPVNQEVRLTSLVDQLLLDIYGLPTGDRGRSESDSTASSLRARPQHVHLQKARLLLKSKAELQVLVVTLREHINHTGGLLVRQLRRKDYLIGRRDKQCAFITAHLQAHSAKRIEDTKMRFSLTPQPGESGFTQWLDAMKMVARLQGGIPPEFRKRLWLTLAERHLEQRGVDWKQAEKLCFNEWSNPDDEELGIQIVKDLHRTGCSLFCGAAGRDNQAVLRRVLLGFARWNKSVGYCQGLNVLAALVLQVMDRAESSAVKVMIYLIEGVLPEGYFADNLRGLSVDMAVFRDLLRSRLPKLSKHLEALQNDAKDKATGSSYEPPLTNVFTMQWFLTLFCHCLPQEAVLRVWDLIFLEGDEVLLRTALAIWEGLSDRIMTVTSADEFYSIMGVLTREMLEFTDTNNLIKNIVSMGPLHGVTSLREKHRYNITPWARKLSDDEDSDTEEDERLAVAAAMFSMAQRLKKDRLPSTLGALQAMAPSSDRERLALDITTLKQQYAKLRERQRQAHIILSAACARQSMVPPPTSQAMNHLLVGKSALVSAKSRPLTLPSVTASPKARPAVLHSPRAQNRKDRQGVTLHWKDTKRSRQRAGYPTDTAECGGTLMRSPQEAPSDVTSPKRSGTDSDSDSTSTELCDEPDRLSDVDSEEPTSTSDCYVMATDDDRNSRVGSSPASTGTPIRSVTGMENDTGEETLEGRTARSVAHREEEPEDGPSISEMSIAKITDQIRRLSAEDDNVATIPQIVCTPDEEEKTREALDRGTIEDGSRRNSRSVTDFAAEPNAEELTKPVKPRNGFGYLNFSPDKNETITIELPTYDEFRSVDAPEKLDGSKGNVGDRATTMSRDDKIEELSTSTMLRSPDAFPEYNVASLRSDYGRTVRNSGVESESPINFERPLEFSSKFLAERDNDSVPIEVSPVKSVAATTDRDFYSTPYVVGHLPISPMNVDQKLSKVPSLSFGRSGSIALSPETTTAGTVLDSASSRATFNVREPMVLSKPFSDAKRSPKTPDSAKSFSSGDTMGPDSKPSSLTTSPRTLAKSGSRDFVLDKSACSSISSDSKTLVLHSLGSDVAKDSPRLDSKKSPYEKSNPSTPISTDSLRNKSEASPKFIVSSSSDSCSPSKVKSSERSFSSDLQSPISANSIKYTSNYQKRGQDISESPADISTTTSPFYPIAHPNQKTPSPYCVTRRKRSGDSAETSPEQKSSASSKDSAKYLGYQAKLDPLQIVDVRDGECVVRRNDAYVRPQFTLSKDDLTASLLSKDQSERVPSSYASRANELYRKSRQFVEDAADELSEKDVLPQLPHEKLDKHFLGFSYRHKDRPKHFERSSSSLERRFADLKSSASTDEIAATIAKKRSSDILEDIKHLEAKALNEGSSGTHMLTKKTGFAWEDLKNLEARRQDNFSDSARSFSKRQLDVPDINVTMENRKSYVVQPRINIDEGSDSILKTFSCAKDNADSDDGRESKLGVWTKVKPRKKGNNGRRSSDRALKIIQENSAILHKILACQAKKRLPDLEEISKEITISPINEEISKIFSPILEKMGLNEHEINEELARINFKDFDNVTATSVSEFDAKINDELSKLSLIDDAEQIDHLDVDEIISHEYLDTREALIDRKINEELSKLLANYEEESSPSIANVDKGSSSQNVSDIEGLDLTSVSTNVFSYKSSNDSIETRSEFGSAQEAAIQPDKFVQYTESVLPYASPKYVQDLSPKSDIDIYRELEKLDKISSAHVLPDTTIEAPQKNLSPISYVANASPYPDSPPAMRYTTKTVPFDASPVKSSYELYKSFDYKPSLSPRKTSADLYASPYDKSGIDAAFGYIDHRKSAMAAGAYDAHNSPVLSKESLEFRVRYEDDSPRPISREFLSLQKSERPTVLDMSLDTSLDMSLDMSLDKDSYYGNGANKLVTPSKYLAKEESRSDALAASFLDFPAEASECFRRKYEPLSPKDYADATKLDFERRLCAVPFGVPETEIGSYLPGRHLDYQALSPSRRFDDQRFPSSINHYASKLSPGSADDSKRPVSHPEFPDKMSAAKYAESSGKGASCYKKSSLSLGNIGHSNRDAGEAFDATPSPKAQFSPFPVRNASRKPKELGLKLGLYSPKGSDIG